MWSCSAACRTRCCRSVPAKECGDPCAARVNGFVVSGIAAKGLSDAFRTPLFHSYRYSKSAPDATRTELKSPPDNLFSAGGTGSNRTFLRPRSRYSLRTAPGGSGKSGPSGGSVLSDEHAAGRPGPKCRHRAAAPHENTRNLQNESGSYEKNDLHRCKSLIFSRGS